METKTLMQIAQDLKIAPTTLRSAVKDGRLNAVKTGRDLFICLDEKYHLFMADYRPKNKKNNLR